MMKRVLVYIEPCIFRDDPNFLRGHLEAFVHPTLQAISYDEQLEFLGFSSNIFLAMAGLDVARRLPHQPKHSKLYPIYNSDLLADCSFCIEDYCRDVFSCSDLSLENKRLLKLLDSIIEDARPDIVITTSQNRYLRVLSSKAGFYVLNIEFGPLPRVPYPANRFISLDGHLSDGAFSCPKKLQNALKKVTHLDASQNIEHFEEKYLKAVSLHPLFVNVRNFTTALRSDNTLSMLALQPEQWITWEGALGKRRSGASIIQEALSIMNTDKLIVTFHADPSSAINPISMREIWLSDCRLELLPNELSTGLSEVFLPFIDELITVSSNVAISAFLLGKPVRAIGTSFASTLDRLGTETAQAFRPKLRSMVLEYIEQQISVDDTVFNDPVLLHERLVRQINLCEDNLDTPSRLKPSLPDHSLMPAVTHHQCENTIGDDLEYIHSRIRERLKNTSPSKLFSIFGRHILGYMPQGHSVGAEFGVAKGYFSESLLRSGRFRLLYSIDRWGDHHNDEEFASVRERLTQFGESSQIVRKNFPDAIADIPDNSLDFLYVDGYAHTGHDADIVRLCLSKLKNNALVAAHDCDSFSWPVNYKSLKILFESAFFTDVEVIPGSLTINDEDIFPSVVARLVKN
jgi:hypothetical protein